jgi:hypothetical protein
VYNVASSSSGVNCGVGGSLIKNRIYRVYPNSTDKLSGQIL